MSAEIRLIKSVSNSVLTDTDSIIVGIRYLRTISKVYSNATFSVASEFRLGSVGGDSLRPRKFILSRCRSSSCCARTDVVRKDRRLQAVPRNWGRNRGSWSVEVLQRWDAVGGGPTVEKTAIEVVALRASVSGSSSSTVFMTSGFNG